jgi:hypothetical protein
MHVPPVVSVLQPCGTAQQAQCLSCPPLSVRPRPFLFWLPCRSAPCSSINTSPQYSFPPQASHWSGSSSAVMNRADILRLVCYWWWPCSSCGLGSTARFTASLVPRNRRLAGDQRLVSGSELGWGADAAGWCCELRPHVGACRCWIKLCCAVHVGNSADPIGAKALCF